MDIILFLTIVGTGVAVISFKHTIIKNLKDHVKKDNKELKDDVNRNIEKLETRFENRINSLEERMFLMATGKTLHDAILEERMKKENPKV